MTDSITAVKDDTCGATGGIEREDGLDLEVGGRCVEVFEHHFQRTLAVLVRVLWGFREKDRMFGGVHAKTVDESVMPYLPNNTIISP